MALRCDGLSWGSRLRERNSLLDGHELGSAALSIQHRLDDLFFGLDHLGSRKPARRIVLFAGNKLKLAGSDARLEAGANLRVGRFSHAAPHGIDKQRPFILNRLALEPAVTRKGQSRMRLLLAFLGHWFLSLADAPLSCFGNHMVCLVAELGGDLPMSRQYFGWATESSFCRVSM